MSKMMLAILFTFCCASLTFAQEDYHKVEVYGGYSIMRTDGIVGDGEVFADSKDGFLTRRNPADFDYFPVGRIEPVSPIVNSGKFHHPRLNGFNASATYNFSKYLGAKFEMSGSYRSSGVNFNVSPGGLFLFTPFDPVAFVSLPLQASYPPRTIPNFVVFSIPQRNTRQQDYNYLGGLQIKNNSTEKKFKPFAHVLAGISHQSVKIKEFGAANTKIFGRDEFTNTGFAMALGGGLDIRLSRRFDLRVIQFDYNPGRIKGQQIIAFEQAFTDLGLANTINFRNLSTATLYSPFDVRIKSRWQNNFRIGVGIVFH